jgi:hypothetical protein
MFVKIDLLSVGLRRVGGHFDMCITVVSLHYKVMFFVIVLVMVLVIFMRARTLNK